MHRDERATQWQGDSTQEATLRGKNHLQQCVERCSGWREIRTLGWLPPSTEEPRTGHQGKEERVVVAEQELGELRDSKQAAVLGPTVTTLVMV